MLAVRAGASSVYACEMSKTMFEVATDIIATNGMSTNVHLIHKNSTELTIPDDIPGRSVHLAIIAGVSESLLYINYVVYSFSLTY